MAKILSSNLNSDSFSNYFTQTVFGSKQSWQKRKKPSSLEAKGKETMWGTK